MAHGGREPDLLASDAFALEAFRMAPERPFRYVVVEDADHGFATSAGHSRLPAVLDDFARWALSSERETSVSVLR